MIKIKIIKRCGNKFISKSLRPPVGASEHSASECRRTAHLGWSGRRPWRTRNVQHALGCRKLHFAVAARCAHTHTRPPTHRTDIVGGQEEGITKTSDVRPAPKTAELLPCGEQWGTGGCTPGPPVFFCLTPRPAAGRRCISYKTPRRRYHPHPTAPPPTTSSPPQTPSPPSSSTLYTHYYYYNYNYAALLPLTFRPHRARLPSAYSD